MRLATTALFVPVSVVVSALARPASACSPPLQYAIYETQLDVANGAPDGVPPTLTSAKIDFKRAEESDGLSSCEGIGRYFLNVDASDDQTAADDLGFSLVLVDGRLPFPLPVDHVQSSFDSGGDLTSWFDDDGSEFDATIEVRVVDRAGNLSDPVNVRASEDAVGCGCSMVGAARPGVAGWASALALVLFARRRRRR